MLDNVFNLKKYKLAGRRRIKDKGIAWKEHYGEKSKEVKKKMEKLLPNAYFRWEGKDYEDNCWRYVVVGPAISKSAGLSFFAGNKKVPTDPKKKAFAPSGKYFPTLIAALNYAREMWGITVPVNVPNYSKEHLVGIDIPRHIKG